MSHTDGKLRVAINGDTCLVEDADGNQIARCSAPFPFDTSWDQRDANARRLVACWNACEGIGTTYLETTTSLREAEIARKHGAGREIRELRGALIGMLELHGGYSDGEEPQQHITARNLVGAISIDDAEFGMSEHRRHEFLCSLYRCRTWRECESAGKCLTQNAA